MFPPLFFRLLVFSREWTSCGGIGGRLDNEEEEEEARMKYKAMCDGIWSLLPTLVSSPVSRWVPACARMHASSCVCSICSAVAEAASRLQGDGSVPLQVRITRALFCSFGIRCFYNLAAGHRSYYQWCVFARRCRPRFVTAIRCSFLSYCNFLVRGWAGLCV